MIKPKITLAITNYQRTDLLLKSFAKVLNDERISEIVISDDCSLTGNREMAIKMIRDYCGDCPKINFYINPQNLGMSRNKAKAVELASNDYCIIFDSDNVMETPYLDALYAAKWEPDTILMPSYAKPRFNYRNFSNLTFKRGNVKRYLKPQYFHHEMFNCLLNTGNYFVHRKTYLEVYEYNPAIKGVDAIWFNYLWLKAGKSFHVVPGMEYDHLVWDGSGWLKDADENLKKGEEIKKLIMDFK